MRAAGGKGFGRPLVLLIILFWLLAGGCAPVNRSRDQGTVRLGYFPNLAHAPALVGLEEGIFARELETVGAKIKPHNFDAGPALMEALASGRLDAGYVGPVPAMAFFSRGAKIKLAAGASEGGAVLVVDPRAGIRRVQDLAGKAVAVPQLTNTQDIVLRLLLEDHSLADVAKGGQVTIVQLAPADLPAVVRQGQVQAALVPEPWGTQLEEQSGLQVLLDWDRILAGGSYPSAVLVLSRDFLSGRPEEAEAILRAHREAVDRLTADPAEAVVSIQKGIARAVGREIPASWISAGLKRSRFTTSVESKHLEAMAEAARRAGYLRNGLDLPALVR